MRAIESATTEVMKGRRRGKGPGAGGCCASAAAPCACSSQACRRSTNRATALPPPALTLSQTSSGAGLTTLVAMLVDISCGGGEGRR